ncbi:tRNA uridine-5-carboxymethylaminomethyl(34) synthesis GTPase MnmE [Chengkuizengella axinellae]|uniref:tRNA modification GTPase MnmE n=1 Tax=Chengkuizengella axinellae TaxID=3064388 RepID=A0ABT9J371_9BACL|nr:tRNA uridine-5-carboxymethylaminomethyl(34) synthesis GTPase MnmE [Chengkuizengella sp. 2205SS18-9]MDP5276076.1 tRNA uridine-5-carboxymethylaminomethyl(34) synthesis GTPase MnmE [Chengkuizengella sp. 2205SS18-9]
MISDTIAAISTPLGEGGIAMIRISGPEAVSITDTIFFAKKKCSEMQTHTVQYGFIKEPDSGLKVDEVLLTVMLAPKSFTKENVVEISCHGGLISVKKILELLLRYGARLAEPGEFTKRAFLNGRIDLTQAEAVIDLIRSKSDRAYSVAMKQVEGSLSEKIISLRNILIELMAHIEVNIDYPEHDVEDLTYAYIADKCKQSIQLIDDLLKNANQGKILREGIVTAIVGRPNVGKSSLLNLLARENKAIVTDIPGTTRDVIEEFVTVGGVPLKLLDTAGLRETSDIVEKIGVERSRKSLLEAELVLFVLNQNEPLHLDEFNLFKEVENKQVIVILNKTDLPAQIEVEQITKQFSEEQVVKMSIKNDKGQLELEKVIANMFFEGKIESTDSSYVSNVRHIHLLNKAKRSLEEALNGTHHVPIDMLQIDIRNAWEDLGEVIGDSVSESLIDQIFSQFCLGK